MMMKIAAMMDLGGDDDADYDEDEDLDNENRVDEDWEKLKAGTGEKTGAK